MKKFYTLMLTAVFAVASANAFNMANTRVFTDKGVKEIKNIEGMMPKKVDNSKIQKIESMTKGVSSRADEALDVTKVDLQIYKDFFAEAGDPMMSNPVTVEIDEDGWVVVSGFFGDDFTMMGEIFDATLEDGTEVKAIDFPVLQKVGERPQYNYEMCIIGLVEKEDGLYYNPNDDLYFVITEDGLQPAQDYFAVIVFGPDEETGEEDALLGTWAAADFTYFPISNAVYTTEEVDLETLGVTPYTEPMYVEEADGNLEITCPLPSYLLGGGFMVTFKVDGDKAVVDEDPVLYSSLNAGGGKKTGYWYMYAFDPEVGDFSDDFVSGDITRDGGAVKTVALTPWLPMSLEGYWFSTYYQNSLITVNTSAEDGINSVAVDNTKAPVEYYNIQGQKVANPVTGQLYIVKQGTNVNKVIK